VCCRGSVGSYPAYHCSAYDCVSLNECGAVCVAECVAVCVAVCVAEDLLGLTRCTTVLQHTHKILTRAQNNSPWWLIL